MELRPEPIVTTDASARQAVELRAQGTCYGFQVRSEFPFRYLRDGEGEGQPLRVVPAQPGGLRPTDRFVRSWSPRVPNQVESHLYDTGSTYRLSIGKTHWFEVDPSAGIIAAPDRDDPLRREEDVWGIPSALCFLPRGDLATHGAAVEVGRSAVLLAASGGSGKSTLAAAFTRAGYRLLSEDISCVRPAAPPSIVPGPAMLRLRRDVVQELPGVPGEPVRETRDRISYALPQGQRGDCAPVPLAAIVFLSTSPGEMYLERVPAAQAMSRLWSLSLKISTESDKARLFAGIVRLAGQVPAWNLYRPLQLRGLPSVVELISMTCLRRDRSDEAEEVADSV